MPNQRSFTGGILYIFANLLNSNYFLTFTNENLICNSFDALCLFLIKLLHYNFITINILNDQCVALLRYEWPLVCFIKLHYDFFFFIIV